MPDPNRRSPAPSPPLIIYVEKLMRSGRRFVGCYSSVADRLRCVTHKYYATKRNPENTRFNAHEMLCCKPNTQRTLLLRLSRCSYDFARLPTSLGGHASAAPTKALPRPLHALIGGAREHLRAPLACLASLAGGIGVVLCRCWCVCWWHRGRGWWGRHERRRCRRWRRWRLWWR